MLGFTWFFWLFYLKISLSVLVIFFFIWLFKGFTFSLLDSLMCDCVHKHSFSEGNFISDDYQTMGLSKWDYILGGFHSVSFVWLQLAKVLEIFEVKMLGL